MNRDSRNIAKDIVFGVAVGDALGVPVEFKDRSYLQRFPVRNMMGFGVHHQPPGTWSDDTALSLCLAESLLSGYDLQHIANSFIQWLQKGYWTPHGKVFDVGFTTRAAIGRLSAGVEPTHAGGWHEDENGNGSLMRILPLVLHTQHKPIEERFQCAKEVSSLTHAHARSIVACFVYLEYARLLMRGNSKWEAYHLLQEEMDTFLTKEKITYRDRKSFDRLLLYDIDKYDEAEIHSSGYVIHSLEASVWCVLTSHSYEETVLKAVNLGNDTDTTAAIAGGLAGIFYGTDHIPACWLHTLARKEDIEALSDKLQQAFQARKSEEDKL